MSAEVLADLRVLVARKGSYQAAADAIGVAKSTVHDWWHGHRNPCPLARKAIEMAIMLDGYTHCSTPNGDGTNV